MIKNSFRKNINSIRSDNGGEYIKRDFQQYFESEGIQMEHSIPYTPQYNGVAERKNILLKEMATYLLQDKNITPLWAEAVNCASYL